MARSDLLIVSFADYRLRADMLDLNFPGNWVYIGPWTNEEVTAGPLKSPYTLSESAEELGSTLTMYKTWLWGKMQARDSFVLKALSKIDVTSTVLVDNLPTNLLFLSTGTVINLAVKYINAPAGQHLKMSEADIAQVPRYTVNWPRVRTNARWKANVKPPPTPKDSRMPVRNGDYITLQFDGKSHRHAEVLEIHYDQSDLLVIGINEYDEPIYGNRFPITYLMYRIHAINMQLVWSDKMPGQLLKHETIYDSTAPAPAGTYTPSVGDKLEVWDRHGNGECGLVQSVDYDMVTLDANSLYEERVASIELTSTQTGKEFLWRADVDGGGFKLFD